MNDIVFISVSSIPLGGILRFVLYTPYGYIAIALFKKNPACRALMSQSVLTSRKIIIYFIYILQVLLSSPPAGHQTVSQKQQIAYPQEHKERQQMVHTHDIKICYTFYPCTCKIDYINSNIEQHRAHSPYHRTIRREPPLRAEQQVVDKSHHR